MISSEIAGGGGVFIWAINISYCHFFFIYRYMAAYNDESFFWVNNGRIMWIWCALADIFTSLINVFKQSTASENEIYCFSNCEKLQCCKASVCHIISGLFIHPPVADAYTILTYSTHFSLLFNDFSICLFSPNKLQISGFRGRYMATHICTGQQFIFLLGINKVETFF